MRRVRITSLAVALILALAALGYVGWRADRDDVAPSGELTSSGERASVMAEAARLTTIAMSWRAASSDADVASAKAVMTPRMRRAYDKTLPDVSQRPAQAAQDVTVRAVIAPLTASTTQPTTCSPQLCSVALLSASRDRAKALLFVNQSATAKGKQKTVLSPTWEIVTLLRRGDHWLIDEMVAP